MAEITSRWQRGYDRSDDELCLELYRLVSIFGASEDVAMRRGADTHELTIYGYAARVYERREISRILVGVSAVLRNAWDGSREDFDSIEQNQDPVGALIRDLDAEQPEAPMRVRQSLDKVIHADTINLDRSEAVGFDGHLLPRVHLYGTQNGKKWKAVIDVHAWCEAIYPMLRL